MFLIVVTSGLELGLEGVPAWGVRLGGSMQLPLLPPLVHAPLPLPAPCAPTVTCLSPPPALLRSLFSV
ncbi:hypothetical protein XENTR_v10020683 [Xenopus tropicalis]|nr:hypothetical protein XENTR_v10020683 [Xenopus tropicalis]